MKPARGLEILGLVAVLFSSPAVGTEVGPRTISTTGEADVKVVPDEVTLTLGVETSDKNLETAKSQNDDVHGVDFRTTGLRKHRDRARSMAIQAARQKAIALAAELGQKVGKPRSIQEGGSGWFSGYGSGWGARWGNYASQNTVQNAGGTSSSEEGALALGQIAVRASVSVTFELE